MLAPRHRAELALVTVTMMWGLTFPLIRAAVQEMAPLHFVAARFAIATLLLAPLVALDGRLRGGLGAAALPGIVLGLLSYGCYILQTFGLRSVPASRAAFITGTSVIVVPLLSPLFGRAVPGRIDLGAALLATVGLLLLTAPDGGRPTVGDLLILACAVLYAFYLHGLHVFVTRGVATGPLTVTQIASIGALGVAIAPFGPPSGRLGPASWSALAFCAVGATLLTFWLQTRFQSRTTPERTALIFALEPVFATLFAYLLLHESVGLTGAAGGALIMMAVVGGERLKARRAREP